MEISNNTLREYLEGLSPLQPYQDKKIHHLLRSLGDEKGEFEALMKLAGVSLDDVLSGGDYFYMYWHWLCRYGRKNAVHKPGRK